MTKLRESNFRLLTAWNLVSYTCVALVFGTITGLGFGHYQIQRFKLLQFRHDEIQSKITKLENQLVQVQKVFEVNMSDSKILKKRAFSTGCDERFEDKESAAVKMNVYEYYEKEPQLFRTISGMDVSLSDVTTQGGYTNFIQNGMEAKYTSLDEVDEFFKMKVKKWTVNTWKGMPDQLSKCYIAVPGLDFD